MMTSAIIGRVRELQALRADAAIAAAKLKARREAFDLENKDLILQLREATAQVDMAETAVKAIAVEIYKAAGDKKPAPGVEIKLFKDYAIDEIAGLHWATEKQLCLIPAQLDVAAIKKLATVQALPFVKVSDVPKAQIATDLSKIELGAEAATLERAAEVAV